MREIADFLIKYGNLWEANAGHLLIDALEAKPKVTTNTIINRNIHRGEYAHDES